MKRRKIYAKYEGLFWDHKGENFLGKAHIYEGSIRWTIVTRSSKVFFRHRLFFINDRVVEVEIPRNNEEKLFTQDKLETEILRFGRLVQQNPLGIYYSNTLKFLKNIESRHFTNSINFIVGEDNEYKKL